jgi:catechol 2,3-dioxygenase-like lactoylglutathione lyase family enzyme
MGTVRELRLVLTVADFDAALALYRDALGLEEQEAWEDQAGRIALLAAGNATIELVDEAQAEAIDRIEVGRRVAGPVRIALEVADSADAAERLRLAGAEVIAGPSDTPWNDRNVRLQTPDGTQLTLFTPLG